jgi:hypothetical protein
MNRTSETSEWDDKEFERRVMANRDGSDGGVRSSVEIRCAQADPGDERRSQSLQEIS